MSNEKNTSNQPAHPGRNFRFWRSWWPVAAFILFSTGVVAWIFYPACPDVRAHRAHMAGMAGFFAWYIPWLIITVRDAWRGMKPPKVNPALLAALEEALGLPDESDEPEWRESEDFADENTAFAYEKEHTSMPADYEVDFEIEKP